MNNLQNKVDVQLACYEEVYKESRIFHEYHRKDKLTVFLRNRRLKKGLQYLENRFLDDSIRKWKVLIVCGGPGSEGLFFLNSGFNDVTVSDFSLNAIEIAKTLNNNLKTLVINAESISLEDNSYDLVVVQDGLHHLTRPALGFTEMLRVAKRAIIVIEPYESLIGKYFGTEWEVVGTSINYVYRWNVKMVEQIVKSYLLKGYKSIKVFRLWDHSLFLLKLTKVLPDSKRLYVIKFIYKLISIFNNLGNMMVCIVLK